MRTLLVTGSGGAGRTTVACATALSAARGGSRTLLLSHERRAVLGAVLGPASRDGADAGDSAADSADGAADAGDSASAAAGGVLAEPVRDVPGLWAASIDTAGTFRADTLGVQQRLGSFLDLLGASPLDAEELTELPGADDLALLRALRDAAAPGTYDVVVVDLPATHSALSALALPEQLRRYLARLLPAERQAARALRPVLAQLAGVPMPAQWAYEAAAHADRELAAVQAVIEDAGTSVRLVVEPGAQSAEAVRTARTGLALFGHHLEAVVANRLLPTGSPDPWLAEVSGRRHKELAALRTELAGTGTAVHELRHLGREPRGTDDLATLDAIPPAPDESPHAARPWTVVDLFAAEGHFRWQLPLPGATRGTVDLVRRGDELVIDAEGFRRILPLPSALRRCTVAGAALREGTLQVRFTPDPALWPVR